MSIVYLLPILPPKSPQAEALSQEIALLRGHFGGELVYVNPNARLPRTLVPRLGFGWANLPNLWQRGRKARAYHFFNPDPFPFPFLLALRRPLVYTITSGISETRPNLAFFRRMAAITVPDERSLRQLQRWGLTNIYRQPPGIVTQHFTHHPMPLGDGAPLRLLVASAPWTAAQFTSKGFDALLATAQARPDLHLTLLWRGVLGDEIRRRVAALGVGTRVTVVDATVDVNATLASVHAAALFATAPGIVKSYPHSLLDALAAGKPVLVSRAIAMSDYVDANGCGVVVETVTPAAIATALGQLRRNYATYARAAATVGQRDFAAATLLDAMQRIYDRFAPPVQEPPV